MDADVHWHRVILEEIGLSRCRFGIVLVRDSASVKRASTSRPRAYDRTDWIGETPRSYAETMEAWRTSCPRLTIFEDALAGGLVERVNGTALRDARVQVTAAGRSRLLGREADPVPPSTSS